MKPIPQKVISVRWVSGAIQIIDQRRLPGRLVRLKLTRLSQVATAIKTLQVRGAPTIGLTAAYGVVLSVWKISNQEVGRFLREFRKAVAQLRSTRPTAVELAWALDRMQQVVDLNSTRSVSWWKQRLLKEARAIEVEDRSRCLKIGRYGAALLRRGDAVITHCNTGSLATAGLGTANAVLVTANAQRKKIHVLACEARPVWQGARLTMWELQKYGVDATLICDSAAASVMARYKVAAVIVGADRIAANGDTANKIGTYALAVQAKIHDVPFYVAAPRSTFDWSIQTGREIPIEVRHPREVTRPFGLPVTAKGVMAFNPAFDVTPSALITGFITEVGVLKSPYRRSLNKLKPS